MNITIVCPYDLEVPGGVQIHCRGLAKTLAFRGHQVQLLAPGGTDTEIDGFLRLSLGKTVRVPSNGSVAPIGVDPRMLFRYELALDSSDVVHVHEPFVPASLAALWRTPSVTPIIGTFHASRDKPGWYARLRWVLSRVARRITVSTAVSTHAADLARAASGVEPLIIPNAVEVSMFATAAPDPWLEGLGRSVITVGRFEPRKGYGVLKRAWEMLGLEDVHLVAVGPDPTQFPGDATVHALAQVSAERLASLLVAADVAVFPSLGGESFGVTLLEAMAAGLPVIASDIGGYRNAGGDAVRWVSPNDPAALAAAIREVLGSAETARAMRAASAERVDRFDWHRIADEYENVYRDAVASGVHGTETP